MKAIATCVPMICASCAALSSAANIRKAFYGHPPEIVKRIAHSDPTDLEVMGFQRITRSYLVTVTGLYSQIIEQDLLHVRANLDMGEWLTTHRKYDESQPYLESAVRYSANFSPERTQANQVLKQKIINLDDDWSRRLQQQKEFSAA